MTSPNRMHSPTPWPEPGSTAAAPHRRKEERVEDRKLRIAAVGDELLAGLGDPRALGWLGRVLARTPRDSMLLESYALPCPEEGTEGLAARWLDEAGRRFSNQTENRLVIGLSGRDIEFGLSTARSRLNLSAPAKHQLGQGGPVLNDYIRPAAKGSRAYLAGELFAAFASPEGL